MDKNELAAKFAAYFDEHMQEILADLDEVISINSIADENAEVKPFGEGSAKALAWGESKLAALGMATKNFGNYAVRGDFIDGDRYRLLQSLSGDDEFTGRCHRSQYHLSAFLFHRHARNDGV